ncbi:LysR family transcriptional regulator [Sciscionella sediminilitoris]|uniref:LysR family transcriptional regulator n=1 Tax=Sciscionella sediminilitoris TaxID=1445613 RepID=UPI0004DED76A|nr:LysR substrate-binding domain-containing protein [Sciscionella sp. SE31]
MLDPLLCRTFLAVAEHRSFTAAAGQLGCRQSTVSQHVRKLEAAVGATLFERDTHSVVPTVDGEAMVGFARSVVETGERALRHFAGAQLRGKVRFGASEDLVFTALPEILRRFRAHNPLVEVELTVELSDVLTERMRAGRLDLAIGKRFRGASHGRLLWRDRLAWVGSAATVLEPGQPVPLVQYPKPSVTRQLALEALEREGMSWRSVCRTSSLIGLRAAALAGLGVMLHASSLIPDGLVELPGSMGLPAPDEIEFVLLSKDAEPEGPAAALADAIGGRLGR